MLANNNLRRAHIIHSFYAINLPQGEQNELKRKKLRNSPNVKRKMHIFETENHWPYTQSFIAIHTHTHTHRALYLYTHTHRERVLYTHTHRPLYLYTHTHTALYIHTHTHTHIINILILFSSSSHHVFSFSSYFSFLFSLSI